MVIWYQNIDDVKQIFPCTRKFSHVKLPIFKKHQFELSLKLLYQFYSWHVGFVVKQSVYFRFRNFIPTSFSSCPYWKTSRLYVPRADLDERKRKIILHSSRTEAQVWVCPRLTEWRQVVFHICQVINVSSIGAMCHTVPLLIHPCKFKRFASGARNVIFSSDLYNQ